MSFRSHYVWRGVFDKFFFQEAGVQERMKEHVMGKIHYGKSSMNNILYI